MKEVFTNFEKDQKINPTDYLLDKCMESNIDQGVIVGKSGREICFKKSNLNFELVDKRYSCYYLKSRIINDNICTFDFFTKNENSLHQINSINNRHPDFIASKYVKIMLSYYQSKYIDIQAIRSIWTNQSDNHLQFISELVKTKDPISAALATFSGKLFSSIGYSHIPRQKLIMNYENERSRIPHLICVDFIKE